MNQANSPKWDVKSAPFEYLSISQDFAKDLTLIWKAISRILTFLPVKNLVRLALMLHLSAETSQASFKSCCCAPKAAPFQVILDTTFIDGLSAMLQVEMHKHMFEVN